MSVLAGDRATGMPPRAVAWEARLDRGLRRGGIAISLVSLAEAVATIARLDLDATGAASVAAGLAAYLVALVDALRRPRLLGTGRGGAFVPLIALGLVCAAALLAARAWPEPPTGTYVTSLAAVVGIYALLVLGARRALVPLLLAFLCTALADGSFSSDPMIAVRSRGELYAYATFVAIGWLLGRALALSATETHRAIDTARETVTLRHGTEHARSAVREVEAFIHDDVLHHLRSLRLGPSPELLPGLRAASADLSGRIRRRGEAVDDSVAGTGLVDLRMLLRATAQQSPVLVTFTAGGQVLLSVEVANAIALGVREGLRNVERHSGTGAAVIGIRRIGAGVVVTLGDDGVGFDPGAVPAGRFGLAHSVIERVEGVGGSAVVDSSPGRGTTLTLSWMPGSSSADAVPSLMGRVARAFAAVVLPGIIGLVPSAIYQSRELAQPIPAVAATTALALVAAFVVPGALRHGLGQRHGQLLLWGAAVASLVNGLALADPADVPEYWASGGAAGVAFLVIQLRPTRETALASVVIAVLPAVVLSRQLREIDDVVRLAPVLTTPAIAIICAHLVRRLVTSFGEVVGAAIDAEARAAAGAEVAASDRAAAMERLAELENAACPVLDAVATGELDLSDEAVGRRLADLEGSLRADLDLARVPQTRAAIRALPDGWRCQARIAGAIPVAADEALAAGISALAGMGGLDVALDVSARSDPEACELALVLRPGGADHLAALQDWDGQVLGPLARLTRSLGVEPVGG